MNNTSGGFFCVISRVLVATRTYRCNLLGIFDTGTGFKLFSVSVNIDDMGLPLIRLGLVEE